MIRLIVSDIDGTLVEDGGSSLKPEVYALIRKLGEQGIRFAAASGRHVAGMKYLFGPVSDEIAYISDNGAYIEYGGNVQALTQYDRNHMAEVVADLRRLGIDIMIDGPDGVYTDSKNKAFVGWLKNSYHFRVMCMDDVMRLTAPFVKIAGCRMSGISDGEVDELREKYGGRLKVTLSGMQWIDTQPPGINKGRALTTLQKELGVAPSETMAFGDQLNDIEMLSCAHYSFAVANARPETKAAARFLADSNVRDGVYKIIRLLET